MLFNTNQCVDSGGNSGVFRVQKSTATSSSKIVVRVEYGGLHDYNMATYCNNRMKLILDACLDVVFEFTVTEASIRWITDAPDALNVPNNFGCKSSELRDYDSDMLCICKNNRYGLTILAVLIST